MNNISAAEMPVTEPFLTDVKALREQARRHMEKGRSVRLMLAMSWRA